ncbi:MAG: hypothetical protein ABR962_03580 [Candidatus Bathyarchaeia archaeon]|jgi:hypothetical protein
MTNKEKLFSTGNILQLSSVVSSGLEYVFSNGEIVQLLDASAIGLEREFASSNIFQSLGSSTFETFGLGHNFFYVLSETTIMFETPTAFLNGVVSLYPPATSSVVSVLPSNPALALGAAGALIGILGFTLVMTRGRRRKKGQPSIFG